jgi:hypothetical protein
MGIEIKQRKVVPNTPSGNHQGQYASLAMDDAGFRAWGFGVDQKEADRAAFDNLCELRVRRCQVQ